jgi:hypothetical protein
MIGWQDKHERVIFSFLSHLFDKLSPHTISVLRNAIEYKEIEQFDYVIKEQNDPLINNDKLMDDFLSMYDRLGLLYSEKERQTIIALKDEMNNAQQKSNSSPANKT